MDEIKCEVILNGVNRSQSMMYATQNYNVTEEVNMAKAKNLACGESRKWTPAERLLEVHFFKQAKLYFPYLSEEKRSRIRDILCLIYRNHIGMRDAMSIVAALIMIGQRESNSNLDAEMARTVERARAEINPLYEVRGRGLVKTRKMDGGKKSTSSSKAIVDEQIEVLETIIKKHEEGTLKKMAIDKWIIDENARMRKRAGGSPKTDDKSKRH